MKQFFVKLYTLICCPPYLFQRCNGRAFPTIVGVPVHVQNLFPIHRHDPRQNAFLHETHLTPSISKIQPGKEITVDQLTKAKRSALLFVQIYIKNVCCCNTLFNMSVCIQLKQENKGENLSAEWIFQMGALPWGLWQL